MVAIDGASITASSSMASWRSLRPVAAGPLPVLLVDNATSACIDHLESWRDTAARHVQLVFGGTRQRFQLGRRDESFALTKADDESIAALIGRGFRHAGATGEIMDAAARCRLARQCDHRLDRVGPAVWRTLIWAAVRGQHLIDETTVRACFSYPVSSPGVGVRSGPIAASGADRPEPIRRAA